MFEGLKSRWMIPFWCGVLHGLADQDEEVQPLGDRELVAVAVLGDRDAADQLHHEVGPAGFRRPAVENLGDVRVVHHRQRLPLGLERAITCLVSMPGLMILSATMRRTGAICSAT